MGVLIEQYVNLKWQRANKTYLELHGYKFTRLGNDVKVHINHIKKTSHTKVKTQCDYCGGVNDVSYRTVVNKEKYKCQKCARKGVSGKYTQVEVEIYLKERGCVLLSKYNHALDKIVFKCSCGNIEGSKTFNQYQYNSACKQCCEEIRCEKLSKTSKANAAETRKKAEATMLLKYGTTNPYDIPEVRNKIRKTNLQRYGVPFVMMNKEILAKGRASLTKNGKIRTSLQQLYIHNVVGGSLNKEIGGVTVDIAFENEKIYIEYDGGGHTLPIKLGQKTETEFRNLERKRELFLKGKNWRLIRIKSSKDKLPSKKILFRLIEKAKEIIRSGRSYVEVNIDNAKLVYKDNELELILGRLKKPRRKSDI